MIYGLLTFIVVVGLVFLAFAVGFAVFALLGTMQNIGIRAAGGLVYWEDVKANWYVALLCAIFAGVLLAYPLLSGWQP